MEEKQIIEVEYDEEKVEEYKNNYIQEVEGMGAGEDAEPYDPQTTFNTDPIEVLLGEGAVIDELYKNE